MPLTWRGDFGYKKPMPAHVFVVSRHQPDLYAYLSREFAAEEDVRVLLDRRQGERRRVGDRRRLPRGDRRQTDRRLRGEVPGQINTLGYAFVRVP
jgi:hypothetical protein